MKWITALQLETWADTVQARTIFPELIADLLIASVSEITGIRFPGGDKGQVRGFDGVLESIGAPPYVPEGKTIWEFGVNSDAATKAEGDYEKRTSQVAKEIRDETTFVFVSPRTWDNPRMTLQKWIKDKQDLRQWKDVKYIDGSMLEKWLDSHPPIAARYAKNVLKLLPISGAYSTDEFWEEYSSRFNPTLTEDVVLAGRESQAAQFIESLKNRNPIKLAADSPDEVLAFAIAAIRKADSKLRDYFNARSLVVDSPDAARQLLIKDLIFFPRGQARELTSLLASKAPTISSAGISEVYKSHEQLERPSATNFGKALETMGFSSEEAYLLARKCSRSITILARLNPSSVVEPPEWLSSSAELLPAMLAGAWSVTSIEDKAILQNIAGCTEYESVEAPLRRLVRLKDAPVEHVGDVWTIKSSVDAFMNLAHLLGDAHLARFKTAVTTVFSTITYTPKSEDIFQHPSLRPKSHSSWLRDGMMTTLLHMSALHADAGFRVTGSTPQNYVDGIVRELPNLSSDYRLLASLRDNLALLAEAAPTPFLEALERLLEGDGKAIKPIFEEQQNLLSSGSPHVGILWGLEVIAWDPKYLLRAAICLARLASIDPGGQVSNRPINSLREIFLTWSPNTLANSQQRIGTLNAVLKSVPEVAWELLLSLLPKHYDSSQGTSKPKFQESKGANTEALTYGVVWETQSAIIKLAVEHAQNNSERWVQLVGSFDQFQPESFKFILEKLDHYFSGHSEQNRFTVWDALRKEANRHKAFSTAEWALKEEFLSLFDELIKKYQPSNPLLIHSWLFDDWMPDVALKYIVSDDELEDTELLRESALKEIYQSRGLLAILTLAESVKLPHTVAQILPKLKLPLEEQICLLKATIKAGSNVESLVFVLVDDGFNRFDVVWVEAIKEIIEEFVLSSLFAARLFLGLPDTSKTWQLISSYGVDIERDYWKQKKAYSHEGEIGDLLFAIEKYICLGRPLAGIEASSKRLNDIPSNILLKLLDESVSQINTDKNISGTMLTYFLERIFDVLESRTDITLEEISLREFKYLPIFKRRRKPLFLHHRMVQSPEFFMSVVSAVFRPANSEARELTPEEKRFASASYELLSSLVVLPGQNNLEVEHSTLQEWCAEVRKLGKKTDREKIIDICIGRLLAHAPASNKDSAWPHESVRQLIEDLASEEVERGIITERFNMRGVYSKAVGEGGEQERALEQQAHKWAEVSMPYVRTSLMLTKIAESWSQEAKFADLEAEKNALRW